VGVGVATGAYGLSYGALGTSAGLSVVQTCALSVLMFSGGEALRLDVECLECELSDLGADDLGASDLGDGAQPPGLDA
jgi:hypothetical protein